MENIPRVIQGEDFTIPIKYIDDNGNFVALSTMTNYQAYIFYKDSKDNKRNLYTYKKTPVGNDSPIMIIDVNTMGIILSREQSLLAPLGELYLNVSIMLPSTSDYINSVEKKSAQRSICEIVTSPNGKSMI